MCCNVYFLGQNLYACKLKVQKNEEKIAGGDREAEIVQYCLNKDPSMLVYLH